MSDGSIRRVYCSLNGESFGAKEWGVATIRAGSSMHAACRLVHPADCFGDLGGAWGPVLVGLAALGLGEFPDASSLVWCASEAASRVAVVVSREPTD